MTSPVRRMFALAARLVLGGLFLYSGLSKIGQPYQFAASIQAYQLLPQFLVGLAAVFIPWVETVSAVILLAGRKPRSALIIFITLLAIFMIILMITMFRGLDINCGCGLLADRRVGWLVLAEDGLLLIMASWLYYSLLPQAATLSES